MSRPPAWTARITGRAFVLGALTGAGLLALIASSQPWWRAVGTGIANGADGVTFSGADTTGGLSQALAVVVLAGALLTLVLAARGRRLVAILVFGVGLGATALGLGAWSPSAETVRTRFRQVSLVEQFTLEPTGWRLIYGLTGVVVVLAAVFLFVGAPRWPVRGRRFERRTQPVDAGADPAAAWRALDAGLDPTLDPTLDSPLDSGVDREAAARLAESDPDVHKQAQDDTMERSPDQPRVAKTELPRVRTDD